MAYTFPTTLPALLVSSIFAAVDYYVITIAGREIQLKGVTKREEIQTPITSGTYRDQFQSVSDYGSGGALAYVKDQTSTTGTPVQKSPDDVMHVDPRFLNAIETWVIYTANGAPYGIPKKNIIGEGTSPSRLI